MHLPTYFKAFLQAASCSKCFVTKYVITRNIVLNSVYYSSNGKASNGAVSVAVKRYEELKHFMDSEPQFVDRLNRDFALPYVNLKSVKLEDLTSPNIVFSGSALYDFYINGSIAKPGIDIDDIITRHDEVAKNIRNRK